MSNKKILTISILSMFTVILIIVGLILFSVNRKQKMLIENVDIIKSNYAKFSSNTSDSEKIKEELTDKLTTFSNETYEEEHQEYQRILKEYDANIKYINEIVEDLEERCQYKYDDTITNLLCRGYDILYEESINSYITNVNEYNNKLTMYNDTADKKYNLHTLIYDKYIDYDKDGEYEGK